MSNWDTQQLFAKPSFRVVDSSDGIDSIFFENEPHEGKPTEVFAYMGVPRTDKPVPAIVLCHGGGGKAFKEWVQMWMDRGYAAIAFDQSGRDGSDNRHNNAGPDQGEEDKFSSDLEWEDLWTYHSVAAAVRAHSLLLNADGVDPDRTCIHGISWGGYLTCITAAVDQRFKCAVPVYGCGHLQHNSAEGWMNAFAKMTPERRKWWHDRCDPSVYLAKVVMPMMFVSSTNDMPYPLDILKMSYLLPQGPVSTCIRYDMEHSHQDGWAPDEIQIFCDQHVNSGDPLPIIDPSTRDGLYVSAAISSERPIKRGYLLHTSDSSIWQERRWTKSDASVDPSCVSVTLPDGTTSYFLAIEDDRGAYVSCQHEETLA